MQMPNSSIYINHLHIQNAELTVLLSGHKEAQEPTCVK